jgi:hypothetical protein
MRVLAQRTGGDGLTYSGGELQRELRTLIDAYRAKLAPKLCGLVVSANFATKSKGQPTFLNFDQPYPSQIFTVMIWGSDRPKFGAPEQTFMGKRVCATGVIKEFRGKPEIVATDPRQLAIK